MINNEIQQLIEKERAIKEKYGFVIHCVPLEEHSGFNCHTHGLEETFNHPELQVTLNTNPETLYVCINTVVDTIVKKGLKVQEGELITRALTCNILPIKATHGNPPQKVIRLILPDATLSLDKESMDKAYAIQYEILTTEEKENEALNHKRDTILNKLRKSGQLQELKH